jgi:hypothetical protein
MAKYTEDALQAAIDATKAGASIKSTARNYGIPESTLRGRLAGRRRQIHAHGSQQKLSPVQEAELANWALVQGALGLPPTHQQIRSFACRVVEAGGSTEGLGKNWLEGFFRRNPSVRTVRARRMDSARVNGASTEKIQAFFDRYTSPAIQKIKPEHRWNMDETGIMEGLGVNGLVVGSAEARSVIKKDDGRRNWTTIIECVSATGQAVDPLIIFKGKDVQQQWFPKTEEDLKLFESWHFRSSPKGWTSDEIALEWLKTIFVLKTRPARNDTRLLVVDGHGSHVTDDFMYLCFRNNIHLLFFPAHASHVLQPLDLSVFSALKAAYRKEVGSLIYKADDTPLGKRNFLLCYYRARGAALTDRNMRAGWKAAGLWPVDPGKPLNSRLVVDPSRQQPVQQPIAIVPEVQFLCNSPIPLSIAAAKVLVTPAGTKDLGRQFNRLKPATRKDPANRLLLQKAGKALDQKNYLLAKYQAELQVLRVHSAEARAEKRKKVEREDPNAKFTTIRDVKRTRMAMEPTIEVASS